MGIKIRSEKRVFSFEPLLHEDVVINYKGIDDVTILRTIKSVVGDSYDLAKTDMAKLPQDEIISICTKLMEQAVVSWSGISEEQEDGSEKEIEFSKDVIRLLPSAVLITTGFKIMEFLTEGVELYEQVNISEPPKPKKKKRGKNG